MKRVYTSDDYALVGHLEQVLRDHGIEVLVKNRFLVGGAGQLPVNECWPELWVMDDALAARAREVLAAALSSARPGPDWRCPGCGEPIEAQFTECWRCGAAAPDPD